MTNSVGCNETLFHNSQAMARKMVSRGANLHGRRRNRFFMQRERPPSHLLHAAFRFHEFSKREGACCDQGACIWPISQAIVL